MATAFHFKAVAADGKVRTGTITSESDKAVARELLRQGLTPVFVGTKPPQQVYRCRSSTCWMATAVKMCCFLRKSCRRC